MYDNGFIFSKVVVMIIFDHFFTLSFRICFVAKVLTCKDAIYSTAESLLLV